MKLESWIKTIYNTFHKSNNYVPVKISTLCLKKVQGSSNQALRYLGSIHSGAFYIKTPKDCGNPSSAKS